MVFCSIRGLGQLIFSIFALSEASESLFFSLPANDERASGGLIITEVREGLRPIPVIAVVAVHADVATLEAQDVSADIVVRLGIRRPVVAVAENAEPRIHAVIAQDRKVEVLACIGCRRESRIIDTTVVV